MTDSIEAALARVDAARDRELTPIRPPADHALGWPALLDLSELLASDPEPPRWIIEDWLPCGYATMLAGHGGAGKSSIALHLSAAIATGSPFFGLPTSQRRVLYLSCEDRADVLHWRLTRICDHTRLATEQLAESLSILDLVGHDALLYRQDAGGMTGTPGYLALLQRIQESSAEVLVVDGSADVFSGNENDRGEVKRFINALVATIPTSGAVLLLAHVNKPAASSGSTSQGYSGSTSWHNSVRARWYLRPETERTDDGEATTGDLLLELQKSNLGRADQAMRFSWDPAAHLFVGRAEASASHFEQRERDERERQGILDALHEVIEGGDYCPAALQGPRTAQHVLAPCSTFPESLQGRANSRRFRRHLEYLRRIGLVRESSMRRANRHLVVTLEPGPANGEGCADASNTPEPKSTHSDAGATAPNAPHSAGGTRGGAHAQQCPRCDGEGCAHCEPSAAGTRRRGED